MKIAVEVDGNKVLSPIQLDPPHGTRIHHDAESAKTAEQEISGGKKSYRKPARAIYFILEWTGTRGTSGRLIDWVEHGEVPVTRYAELF